MHRLLSCALLFVAASCSSLGSGGQWSDLSSADSWRGYRKDAVPAPWVFDGGTIHLTGGGAGDLMTVESYGSFDLELEWKISPGGNSGIMWRVTEDQNAPYMTGPEMQVLDNGGHGDGRNPKTSAGSNYALHAPPEDVTRPVGEWNQVRILADGANVTYWLNGEEQCAFELWGEEWNALVAGSKFANWPRFGKNVAGHIVLQDHGNEVWYRNVRIRRL